MQPPISNAYVVPNTRLAAGEYPGSPDEPADDEATRKLEAFLDAGINVFIDLTHPADPLEPYVPSLRSIADERGVDFIHERPSIRDMDVCSSAHLGQILDSIDQHLANDRCVYVHCWGGVGRTGMVIGCWLVRHGRKGDDALREVNALFQTMSPDKVKRHEDWGSPQTNAQRAMVRGWAARDAVLNTTRPSD